MEMVEIAGRWYPVKILIDDGDGGYFVATLTMTTTVNPDDKEKEMIPVYRNKEYYHDKESAIRNEF